MKKLLRYFFIGITFPLLTQYVIFFQFTPNYTQDLFSEQTFTRFYGSEVYQSRKLGKELHLWTYHKLYNWSKMKHLRENEYLTRRLKPLDPNADGSFYMVYFFISSVFSVLMALTLLYLFDDRKLFPGDGSIKDAVTCFFILLVAFTEFVVTPYDAIGYFFQAAGMLLFLKFLKTKNLIFYALLILDIVLATTNRETSLIILSFMAAVYFSTQGFRFSWIKTMILPVLAFAVPYLWLKLQPGAEATFTNQNLLLDNLNLRNPYGMMGLLFAGFAIYFMYRINRNKPLLITRFLIFSLPYIIVIFVAGIMVEFRLWLPLIEGAIVLAMLDMPEVNRETANEKRIL